MCKGVMRAYLRNTSHEYPSFITSLWEPEMSNQPEAERGLPISAALLLLALPTLGYSCLQDTMLLAAETSPLTLLSDTMCVSTDTDVRDSKVPPEVSACSLTLLT